MGYQSLRPSNYWDLCQKPKIEATFSSMEPQAAVKEERNGGIARLGALWFLPLLPFRYERATENPSTDRPDL